jgi:phosphoribosyl-ATP pyrophosphohydrolase
MSENSKQTTIVRKSCGKIVSKVNEAEEAIEAAMADVAEGATRITTHEEDMVEATALLLTMETASTQTLGSHLPILLNLEDSVEVSAATLVEEEEEQELLNSATKDAAKLTHRDISVRNNHQRPKNL